MIERIYIPTVRRPDNQITYNSHPRELQERMIMVVEPGERHLYDYDCEYLEIPEEFVGSWTQLAQTRKFIHKHAGAIKYAVVDDDVIIRRRNSKYWTGGPKYWLGNLGESNMDGAQRVATGEDILEMYDIIDKWFEEPDIGLAGLSDSGKPPSGHEYDDTNFVCTYVFYDGRMVSKVIDDMDITSLRVAEDVLFMYEALARGVNSRKASEWIYDNRSMFEKDLQDSRIVWTEMYTDGELPESFYQSDAHYDAMRYIQKKYPHAVKIYKKNGKMHNIKYWKKVYNPEARSRTRTIRIGTGKTVKILPKPM